MFEPCTLRFQPCCLIILFNNFILTIYFATDVPLFFFVVVFMETLFMFQVLKMESEKLRLVHSDREKVFEDEATIGDQ